MPVVTHPLRRRSLAAVLTAAALPLPASRRVLAELPPPRLAGVAIPEGQIERAIARLDALAGAARERSRVPGFAVAVVHAGRTAYARGFGVRRLGEPDPVDADTVFQLASLSKPLGATVVAQQVGAGRITWETPVIRHLPWFALGDEWVTRRVTVADLYAHRSGLPDHAGDDLEDLGHGRRHILERLRLLPLSPFRAHYAYTNFGLTAAAEAVAAAAGTDWETLCEQALYRPLGMASTSSRFAEFAARRNRAHPHVRTAGGFAPSPEQRQPDAQSAAGGVSSSIRDLSAWMAMVLAGGRHGSAELVPAAPLLAAVTPHMLSNPPAEPDARASFYGYGFGVGVEPSGRVTLSHSGAFNLGAATTFLLLPSAGVGIAVLSNAQPVGMVEALAHEFADLVQFGTVTRDWLVGFGALMAFAPTGRLVGRTPPSDPAPVPPQRVIGRYANAYFGEAMVAERDGRLELGLGPGPLWHALGHWQGPVFHYRPRGENAVAGSISAVEFAFGADGGAREMTVEFLDEQGLGTFRRLG